MTTDIYQFEQGRLLVREERVIEGTLSGIRTYPASGIPIRIGKVRRIEKVLSVDTNYSKYGLLSRLEEVKTSGDEIFVVMRRGDIGTPTLTATAVLSGCILSGGPLVSALVPCTLDGPLVSGTPALGLMSGLTSGLAFWGPLVSGALSGISGLVVTANVLGY